MMSSILTDWTDENARSFTKKPLLTGHNLHEHDLFTDDGLIDFIDRYPREHLNLYTMDNTSTDRTSFRCGVADGISGKDILDAVKRGLIWLNFRNSNHYIPEYGELTDQMFEELEANVPGLKTLKRDNSLLISSPKVRVFYHFDVPLVTLWQLRGIKNVWMYPCKEELLSNHDLEAVVLKETEEEVPYKINFDDQAQMTEFKPGMMLSWPQFGPHRIDNTDTMNVSLSCEYQTPMSIVTANAAYTNGILRRSFGMNPNIYEDNTASLLVKAAAARVFKLMRLRKSFEHQSKPTFKIDPMAECGISELKAA